jgi:hypothetical protein
MYVYLCTHALHNNRFATEKQCAVTTAADIAAALQWLSRLRNTVVIVVQLNRTVLATLDVRWQAVKARAVQVLPKRVLEARFSASQDAADTLHTSSALPGELNGEITGNVEPYVQEHTLKLDLEYFERLQVAHPLGINKRKAAAATTAATSTVNSSDHSSQRSRKQPKTAAVAAADDDEDVDVAEAAVASADVSNTDCWVCCDRCDKWHLRPASVQMELPEIWYCEMNDWSPDKVVCRGTAAAAAAAVSGVQGANNAAATTTAATTEAPATSSAFTAPQQQPTVTPADTEVSEQDKTAARVSAVPADSASKSFVYPVTGTIEVLKLSCNMQLDCSQADGDSGSDLDDDDSDIDEYDSDDDAKSSADSDTERRDSDDEESQHAPLCTVVQCAQCGTRCSSQARLAQHKCAGAQLMQDVGSRALRYLMQCIDNGSMLVTTRESHQLGSHIQQQQLPQQQPAPAPRTLTAGWAQGPPIGKVYGATYIKKFAVDIDSMFAAGNANSGVKKSAAQMLIELQRQYPDRYDLPSESDIARRISKLSTNKKQAQDDDY